MKIEEFLEAWIGLQNDALGKEAACWELLGKLDPDQLPLLAAQLMLQPKALSRIGWGRLLSIDFKAAGLGQTTARAMLEVLLAPNKLLHDCGPRYAKAAASGPLLEDLAPRLADLGRLAEIELEELTFQDCMNRFQIAAPKPVRVLNRTAIFQTTAGYVAFKIQKGLPSVSEEVRKQRLALGLSEEVAPKVVTKVPLEPRVGYEALEPEPITELLREQIILEVLGRRKAELGLRSSLPVPVGVYVIHGFPLDEADPQGRKLPRLDPGGKSIYLWKEDQEDIVIAYVYTTLSLDYFTYLVDPELGDPEFAAARDKGFHDLYCLMRHGLFPTALADLFHARVAAGNIETNRIADGMGRYRVLNDVLVVGEAVGKFGGVGSGKLGTWMAAIDYVNLRGSGIADFADFRTLDDCISENSNFRKEFFNLLKGEPSYQSRIMVNLLAEPLLVYELVMARRYVEKGRMRYDAAENVAYLGNEMLDGLALALSAYTGCPQPLAKFLFASTLDAGRIGAQMSFFLSTSHAEVFETRSADRQRELPAVLAPLYEPGTTINVLLGELLTGVIRGAGDERVVHRCLRVGTGSGFSDDWKDPDLGPFSGPNPCKETERSRFVFAALALLVREAIEAGTELGRQSDAVLKSDRATAIALLRKAVACWPFDKLGVDDVVLPSAAGELKGLLADDKDTAAQAETEALGKVQLRRARIEDDMAELAPQPLSWIEVDRNPRPRLKRIQEIVQEAHKQAEKWRKAYETTQDEDIKLSEAVALLRQALADDPFDRTFANAFVEARGMLDQVPESQVWDEVARMQDEFLAKRMPS